MKEIMKKLPSLNNSISKEKELPIRQVTRSPAANIFLAKSLKR
jgi:hypothetical protein